MPSLFERRLAGSVGSVLAGLLVAGLAGAPVRAVAASSAVSAGDAVSMTFYLSLRNEAAAEQAAEALQVPGTATYHQFLTVKQFVNRYAASDATVAEVGNVLTQLGYTVTYVFANHLAIEATAPAGTVQSTLGVELRRITVNGRGHLALRGLPRLPAAIAAAVRGIGGLDGAHVAHPLHVAAAGRPAGLAASRPAGQTLVGGTPGNYLPADFAARYDVDPLYQLGVNGRGSTIGIVTLANFYPADAFTFWQGAGIPVSKSRLTVVDVDGGADIAPADALGEGETDLDVEESGGLSPAARLRVYIAPNNTNANFIDGFEAVASENIADTVSTSWGEPELDFFAQPAIGQPDETAQLADFHDVFLEMALQGQTLYVASGDSGAFDTVEGCSPYAGLPSPANPVCNAPFAVDSPSDDPLVTASGGTTTPFTATLTDGITLSVTAERAWAWDYIRNQEAAQGQPNAIPIADLFSVGDGGGVSSYYAAPWYQQGVAGITATKPNQSLTEDLGPGPVTLVTLPSGFAGRNMPDLSTDADPESGYQYVEENQIVNGYGGTSFVAPQLNGVTSLLVQALGGRVGQINPALYQLGTLVSTDNSAGNNWGYKAVAGYDNATGVGTLDAARLAIGLGALKLGF